MLGYDSFFFSTVLPEENNCLQRQFNRLIEMMILLRLDPRDQAKLRAYRLQVKERLYRFNFASSFPFFPLVLDSQRHRVLPGNPRATRKRRKIREVGRNVS